MASELPAEGPGAVTAVSGAFSAFLDRIRERYEGDLAREAFFRERIAELPFDWTPAVSSVNRIGEFDLTYDWPLKLYHVLPVRRSQCQRLRTMTSWKPRSATSCGT